MNRPLPATLLLVLLMTGCSSGPTSAAQPASAPPSAPMPSPSPPAACGSPVVTSALPTWARGGFNFDGAGTSQVYGRSGDIVAIVFGTPLSSSPIGDHNNKILWVTRFPAAMGDTLQIHAALDGTAETADRKVDGGPGPSIIDLPRPGCWRLTLQWNGHTDTMDLTYS